MAGRCVMKAAWAWGYRWHLLIAILNLWNKNFLYTVCFHRHIFQCCEFQNYLRVILYTQTFASLSRRVHQEAFTNTIKVPDMHVTLLLTFSFSFNCMLPFLAANEFFINLLSRVINVGFLYSLKTDVETGVKEQTCLRYTNSKTCSGIKESECLSLSSLTCSARTEECGTARRSLRRQWNAEELLTRNWSLYSITFRQIAGEISIQSAWTGCKKFVNKLLDRQRKKKHRPFLYAVWNSGWLQCPQEIHSCKSPKTTKRIWTMQMQYCTHSVWLAKGTFSQIISVGENASSFDTVWGRISI